MNNPNDIIEDLRLLQPDNPWLYGAIAGLLLLLLVCSYLVWRRRLTRVPIESGEAKGAQENALEELEKARLLIKPGNSLAYGIAVSGIIRRYIERGFGIMAPRRTTEEFLKEAARYPGLAANYQSLLAQFLACCDFMKFARGQAEIDELEALHASAVRFVSETRHTGQTEETKP